MPEMMRLPDEEYDDAFPEQPIEETAAYKSWLDRWEAEHFAACEFDA